MKATKCGGMGGRKSQRFDCTDEAEELAPEDPVEGSEAPPGRLGRGKHAEHIVVLSHVNGTWPNSHGDHSWMANLLVEDLWEPWRATATATRPLASTARFVRFGLRSGDEPSADLEQTSAQSNVFRSIFCLSSSGRLSSRAMDDVTRILSAVELGDPRAAEQLLPLVYEELRKLAAARLAQEKPGQTLQATALVHDVYIRLVDVEQAQHWSSRGHFFAAAAEAMRRILVESARRKRGPEAGGGHCRVELSDVPAEIKGNDLDLVALSDSLDRLQIKDPRAAELVKLRFFAGLTRKQAAEALGVSVATADNDWAYAKGWLKAELAKTSGST